MMLVGEDPLGIAAAAWTENIDGPGQVFLKAFGVATRCRNLGGNVADALIHELMQRLASLADAAGARELLVQGYIHPKNEASKRCVARSGGKMLTTECGFELWALPAMSFDHDDSPW